jgi:hypothetical protein
MGKTLEMRGNICFLEPQVSRCSLLFIYLIVASILFFEGGDLQTMRMNSNKVQASSHKDCV